MRALTPVRDSVEKRAPRPDLRDVFLCHAWDDRRGAATELHDLLELRGVSVWFSEKDVALGTRLLREIDKGDEVASRDRAGDPCAAAPPPRRGHRRQRIIGTPSGFLLT
ncbi:toll/interleukin-1 receptor domain-containing protein [Mesorhizobium cantuariense]